jgi:hypothetical protein
MAMVGLLVCALLAPLNARADTMTIAPSDDAYVRSQAPTTNFGAADFLDSQGGTDSYTCNSDHRPLPGEAYTYLKFDLSKVPADAVLASAKLVLTSRTGYFFGGDPDQHLRFVGDDNWSESKITFRDSPGLVDDDDIDRQSTFYEGPICDDPKDSQTQTFTGSLVNRVNSERDGDGMLSLQVWNPNCGDCSEDTGLGDWMRYFSKEADSSSVRPKLVLTFSELQAPALYDAVPDEAAGKTTVVGRATGPANTPLTLRFYYASFCNEDGTLPSDPNQLGNITVTTNEDGEAYYAQELAAVPDGTSFVAVRAETDGGDVSPLSRCVAAPDNDVWPRARELHLLRGREGATLTARAQQSLDVDGQARWYAFDVAPDSKVTFDLTNLPANYDMFVFSDIASAFASLTASSTDDLLTLSAEMDGANNSPSAFAPSAFAPSAFAPSAFAPSAFAPSAFAPGAFSPSAFAPSAFAPSAFAPSAFAPSAFAPSAFAPSAFAPEAYGTAQIISLIGGSTQEGDAPESITMNSWGTTRMYVRVNGRNNASAAGQPYDLRITADPSICNGIVPIGSAPAAAPGPSLKTDHRTHPARLEGSAADKSAMLAKLQTLAARPEVAGTIVDLGQNARVAALNAQADAHAACPSAKNLVASAIKDVVDSYRKNNPGLKYVVPVGSDNAVPFFRYPDTSGLGPESDYVPPVLDSSASQASLRRNYVLSQDAYGSQTKITLRQSSVPVPDLAVGRLGETASAVSTMLDAYLGLSGGVAPQPKTSLVTGYDFLADAAHAVQDDLSAGLGSGQGVRKDTLITDSGVPNTDVGDPPTHAWDANRLRSQLLGSRHDIMYLAGHFSANNTLAADYQTTVNSTELPASSVNLTNTLVFSAGCHSGYDIVNQDAIGGVTEPLDWTEAFAQKGATLLAGTGYQYGDTDFLEYSERLYAGFAHQLRVGSGPVPVGSALVKAKQDYLAGTPVMRGIHQKAFLEATLYGLPMFSIDLPAGRIAAPSTTSIVDNLGGYRGGPGGVLNLGFANVSLSTPTTPQSKTLTNLGGGTTTASWLTGPGGAVQTNPGEPALPVIRNDVSVPGRVLRGVGFRGATFDTPEPSGVTPLTGAATTEQQAVHTPFAPSVFYPMRLWAVNYYGALAGAGGATTLSVTPAQYIADAPGSSTSTLRRYTGMDLKLFYSNETATYPTGAGHPPNVPALAGPPQIGRIDDSVVGSDVNFATRIVGDPSAGIQEVWVTYFGVHPGQWESLDLHQPAPTTDSTLWTGTLTLPAGVHPSDVHYIVQSVNGVGLTALDDNFGAYYTPSNGTGAPPQTTSLSLVSPPVTGVYHDDATVTADL